MNAMTISTEQFKIGRVVFPVAQSALHRVTGKLGLFFSLDVIDVEDSQISVPALYAFSSKSGHDFKFLFPLTRLFPQLKIMLVPIVIKAFSIAVSVLAFLSTRFTDATGPTGGKVAFARTVFWMPAGVLMFWRERLAAFLADERCFNHGNSLAHSRNMSNKTIGTIAEARLSQDVMQLETYFANDASFEMGTDFFDCEKQPESLR